MEVTRRTLFKRMAGAGTGCAALAGVAEARPAAKAAPVDAVGMLFDATRCIGCKACVVACHEANDLPPARGPGKEGLYDAPLRLDSGTKNIIKLYREGSQSAFMKQQCMHCIDPACVGACMLGALQKREHGIVWWDGTKCVGCRYCQMACPYNIPKFEWESRNPRIIKCELCRHLLAKGEEPACCRVCPREAVIYGRRSDLLDEAKRRLADHPDRYVDKVYGEHDGGGTQVLYLSHVPFEKLGLPDLGEDSQAEMSRKVQHTVFKWVLAPALLLMLVGASVARNMPGGPTGTREEES